MIRYLHWGRNYNGGATIWRNGRELEEGVFFLFTIFGFGLVLWHRRDRMGAFLTHNKFHPGGSLGFFRVQLHAL